MPLVDEGALAAYAAAIQDEGDTAQVSGRLEALHAALILDRARTGRTSPLAGPLSGVAGRVENARTVVAKLDWLRSQRDAGALEPMAWMYFAASDVLAFHAFVRGVFDDLADAFVLVADKPGECRKGSFRELRTWAMKSDANVARLGEDIAHLVAACDWFDDLRHVRDQLVHRAAQTIVFPSEPGIMFQVYDRARVLVQGETLGSDGNVVDFTRYSSAVLSRLHQLVNDSSEVVAGRAGLSVDGLGAWSQHPGLRVSRAWTLDYLDHLASLNRAPDDAP